jgi:NAD+ synthase (glutamine-hydrolysing)
MKTRILRKKYKKSQVEFMDIRNHDQVRVGMISPMNHRTDPIKCGLEHEELIELAYQQGSMVIAGPEGGYSDYASFDYFDHEVHQEATLDALEHTLQFTAEKNINAVIIVGAILNIGDNRFNCAVVMQKGEILGIVPKVYLPNNAEFDEERHYRSGKKAQFDEVELLGQTVPFGFDLIFESKFHDGLTFAVNICEDDWVMRPQYSIAYGALLVFNLSASPDMVVKEDYVEDMFTHLSAAGNAAYCYTSVGVGMDSTDITFSGQILIAARGQLQVNVDKETCPKGLVVGDIDLYELREDRLRTGSWADSAADNRAAFKARYGKDVRTVLIDGELGLSPEQDLEHVYEYLLRDVNKHPFVPVHDRQRHCMKIFNIQVNGLVEKLRGMPEHMQKAFIGVSGGLDSSLALAVAVAAMDKLGMPRTNVVGITMPAKATTSETREDALDLMRLLGVSIDEINIKALANSLLKTGKHDSETEDLTFENAHASVRAEILRIAASMGGGIIINTSDLTEAVLGWATKYADHAGDYGVNQAPKTVIRFITQTIAMLNVFNLADKDRLALEEVLVRIADREISPELKGTGQGISQSTEDILGPFELHDFFLCHFLRFGRSPYTIARLAVEAFDGEYDLGHVHEQDGDPWGIKDVLKIFITRFFGNTHKRNVIMDAVKLGTIGISPRRTLRLPSGANPRIWLENLKAVPDLFRREAA